MYCTVTLCQTLQSSALPSPRQLTREDDHVRAGNLPFVVELHENAWHDRHVLHCAVMTD